MKFGYTSKTLNKERDLKLNNITKTVKGRKKEFYNWTLRKITLSGLQYKISNRLATHYLKRKYKP